MKTNGAANGRRRGVMMAAFLLLALTGGALTAPGARAQSESGVAIDQINTSDFPNAAALVTVRDANGVPVTDLKQDAFEIVEDGRYSFPPADTNTQVNPDAQVSIALVVDLSGSMKGEPLEQAQKASRNLLDTLIDRDNDPDRVAFFGINRSVKPDDVALDEKVEAPFGNDKNRVLNVVNFLTVEGNKPTPLYDALFRVVKLTSQQPGRRAIVVISDGIDTVSKLEADDPITEANRNHIPIFPISLKTNTINADYLQRLAMRTGGVYREAPSPEEFTGLFQKVVDQLKLQYKLDYASRLTEDGQPHSLLVRVRSPLASGYDETKFILNKAAVATTAPDIATLATTAAEAPATLAGKPTAVAPVSEEGEKGMQSFVDDVVNFVKDNPLPAVLIGLAVVLLIILLVLLIVWARRRNAPAGTGAATYAGGGDDWEIAAPAPGGGAPAAGSTTSPRGGRSPAGAERTVGPATAQGGPPTADPTIGPGVGAGGAPVPYAPPRDPYAAPGYPPSAGTGQDGQTVVLERAPKHLALLVNRKNPAVQFQLGSSTDIGRSAGNTMVVSDSTVSRQHAKIKLEGDAFRLYDLGSANGTFVNDKQVAEPVTLAENDLVRFGDVEFTFKQLS